jgi:hypothetical protein
VAFFLPPPTQSLDRQRFSFLPKKMGPKQRPFFPEKSIFEKKGFFIAFPHFPQEFRTVQIF